jgi:hypothetical protein
MEQFFSNLADVGKSMPNQLSMHTLNLVHAVSQTATRRAAH